jgi:TldD protein
MSLDSPISRRVFLRNGALLTTAALTGLSRVPWIGGAREAQAAIMGVGQELREILNLETVNQILIEALRKGGDYADLFAEQRFRTNIMLDGGRINTVTYGYPRGGGVRVLYKAQTGYSFVDYVGYDQLMGCAKIAQQVVINQSPVQPPDVVPHHPSPAFSLATPVPLMPETDKFDLVQRMDAAARAYDPRITSVRVEYQDEIREMLVGNSEGVYFTDRLYLVSITCVPTAVDGGKHATGFGSLGGQVDASYFRRSDPEAVARNAARQAVALVNAGPAPAGPMPVVIASGWGGVFIHESLGHGVEGDGIQRGTSIYAGLLGKQVGSPLLRVVDDARWPYGRGSYTVDDEGVPGEQTVLVDGGVLESYILDRANANLLNMRSTGNGRRQSYRYPPLPRMSNTYIDRGTSDPPSLLNGITKGLYAADLGGGSVDGTSGNFNFQVREGYLIENGRLTRPVRGAVLIGNSLETLKKLEGVGTDLFVDTTKGTCGKDGQRVPVGVGQPTVRFSSIVVGGTAI